jgi:hypothetical protein
LSAIPGEERKFKRRTIVAFIPFCKREREEAASQAGATAPPATGVEVEDGVGVAVEAGRGVGVFVTVGEGIRVLVVVGAEAFPAIGEEGAVALTIDSTAVVGEIKRL